MKRISIFIFTLLIVFSMFVSASSVELLANEPGKQEIKNNEIKKLVKEYEKELKNAKAFNKEEISQLLSKYEESESEIYDSLMNGNPVTVNPMLRSSDGVVAAPIPEYPIGTNFTITAANEYKWNDDGEYAHAYMQSGNNRVCAYASSIFTSQPWAWTGYRWKYTGTGTHNEALQFNDISYTHNMTAPFISSGSMSIYVKLFDATDGVYVLTEKIDSASVNKSNQWNLFNGNEDFHDIQLLLKLVIPM